MRVDVHIPTMNLDSPIDLMERMNIQTDAIICNQTTHVNYEKFLYNNKKIDYYSFHEKGVGLNRNNALMRSEADFCIIADDDLVFKDNYEESVYKNFKETSADVLIFNLIEDVPTRFVTKKNFKVSYMNYMRFGAVRIVLNRKAITKKNIFFSLNFGGGAKYSAGEDTIFLHDCLKKGLRVVAVTESLARLDNSRPSTWFSGYNDKFFEDRGALYAAISPKMSYFLGAQFLIRHKKMISKDISFERAFKLIKLGIDNYNEN